MIKSDSVHFKSYEMKEVKFKIDNIEYTFDTRYMLWKSTTIQIIAEHGADAADGEKKKRRLMKTGISNKNQFEANEKEIQNLKDQIAEYDRTLQEQQRQVALVQVEQDNLIRQYMVEHLETEKVKNARERLEKLKKELGI